MYRSPLLNLKHFALLSVALFLFGSHFSLAQTIGKPKITNYTYQDYKGQAEIRWITEGKNGLMYFSNVYNNLEYDGVNWRPISETLTAGGEIVVRHDDGTLFSAGNGFVGYYEISEDGQYEYVSLSDKIPEEHANIGTIWEMYSLNGNIYFTTDQKLYIWNGESISVIVPDENLHTTFAVNGKIYSRLFNKGLFVLDGNDYVLVPYGEKFADSRVYDILSYDDNTLLICTADDGFYLYDGKEFVKFKTEIDELVEGEVYMRGTALSDGSFVINTRVQGAYRISRKGELLQTYNKANGLGADQIYFLFEDSRNILWFGTTNGVSSLDLNSQYNYSAEIIDEDIEVRKLTQTEKGTYALTSLGMYFRPNGSEQFQKYGLHEESTIRNYYIINERVYFLSNLNGFGEIKEASTEYIRKSVNYDFRPSSLTQSTYDPKRLFLIATTDSPKLITYYFDDEKDQFVEESQINFGSSVDLIENQDGSLWIYDNEYGSQSKMIPTEIDGKLNFDNARIKTYTTENGLPNDIINLFKPYDTLHFISDENDAYSFDETEDRFKKIETFWTDYTDFTKFPRFETKDLSGNIIANFGDGILWIEKKADSEVEINREIFKELNNELISYAFAEEPDSDGNRSMLFWGPQGWIRYEGNLKNPKIPKFETQIRGIQVARDSVIYSGAGTLPNKIELGHTNSTINFQYAAPIFTGQNFIEYSTSLEGLDDSDWSTWSKQTNREYVNLPHGNYTFKVKSKSLTGQVSEVAEIPFSVATPWYQTWWAYALFALALLLLMFAVIRARTSMLRQRQDELEENVELRTAEVQKRLGELATINHVSKALTEKLELNELINLVGKEMKRLFNSDITYLALLDEESQMINFVYQDGDTIAPLKYGDGLTSKIIRTGEPILINRDEDMLAEYDKLGTERVGKSAVSYLGVPIPSEGNILGVISVQSTELESRFNEEDMRLLNTIAINVGVALHNAELFEEAKEAKARAEDANEAKSAFLSTVSHELRTPLTSVLGFAKIIRKRLEDKVFPAVNVEDQKIKRTMKQVNENLNVVISEGERLTTLINDVLDLAKIESGKMEWNKRPIFIQDAINRAIASTQSLIDSKNLKFEKNIPSDLPLIQGDEDKLIQVVINLLSNAIKFTDKGTVKIEAYLDKDQVIVEIQDTGVGISEDDKHKVFERFRQAGDTLTDKPKGTGLGLPICREIIEHHGGIIWMTSEPGVGSTFFFSVPTLKQSTEQKPMQLERILKSLKKQIKHSSQNNKNDQKPTILVVDDDTPIRSLLRQELGEAGYNIEEASNGKAALDMVRNSKPDLIILDVMMPEINGFDVAAVLKNDPATMDIPIIILSIVQDKERGLRIGVDRYLTKPINTEQLFHEVDVLLEQGVSKKKVLVVDDDTTAVKSLSDVLSARGYKVMESNANGMVESATESVPDIIMLNSVHNHDQKLIKDLKLQKGMENVMFFIYE